MERSLKQSVHPSVPGFILDILALGVGRKQRPEWRRRESESANDGELKHHGARGQVRVKEQMNGICDAGDNEYVYNCLTWMNRTFSIGPTGIDGPCFLFIGHLCH